MADCIFCKIINKEAEAEILFEDDQLIAFKDIRPKAPVHVLVVPKQHAANLNDYTAADAPLLGTLMLAAARVAKEQGISESGYKVITNSGDDGGQIIHHFHLHVVGGEAVKVVV
jgi:histidine triad (HIT) family protein